MENFWKTTLSVAFLAIVCSLALNAQASPNKTEKEVIIIEKVKDHNGNVISKKIIRSNDGSMSEEEIEKALEEAEGSQFQQFNFGDLQNFDLGSLFGQGATTDKPTLGIRLKSGDGQVEIADVVSGSGAEEAELLPGDLIISADGFVVSTVEDLQSYISDKENGDQVLLSIVRDGQSFEKRVMLKTNNFNSPFGNMNPDMFQNFGQMFDLGENFSLDFDSILQNLGGLEELKGLNEGIMPFNNLQMPGYSDRTVEEDRPSLGIFIDEVEGGVLVAEVVKDSPAEKAKLKVNDKIIKIDGNQISSFEDLAQMIRAAGKNTTIRITYIRNGKTKEADVVLQ